jgi:hypothetical protein
MGILEPYEGDCGAKESSSVGMEGSGGCWAAIARGQREHDSLSELPLHTARQSADHNRAGLADRGKSE